MYSRCMNVGVNVKGLHENSDHYTCACYINRINLILFILSGMSISNTLFNHSCGITLACTLLLSLKLDLLGMQVFVD